MKHSRTHTLLALVASSLLALAPGCPSDSDGGRARTELVVFAASSLTEAFQALERGFEALHPDVDVRLTFSGSQVLSLQIEQGATADVFATANPDHLAALGRAGHAEQGQTFAHNELVIVVPPANPAGIERFDDLGQASRIVIGTEQVPIGTYTRQLLKRARARLGDGFADAVERNVVSEENNVRLVRAKVELGEADAAIVYRTDAAATDRVRVVPIPGEVNVRARYAIGRLTRAPRAALASRFTDYVLSAAGQQVLHQHGFTTEEE